MFVFWVRELISESHVSGNTMKDSPFQVQKPRLAAELQSINAAACVRYELSLQAFTCFQQYIFVFSSSQ